jgi:hypothetical protein
MLRLLLPMAHAILLGSVDSPMVAAQRLGVALTR